VNALRLSDQDVRRLAVAVADELERRRGQQVLPETGDGCLSASEVAERLGVTVGYVYQHRSELGGFALGDGPRARLRFPVDAVSVWRSSRRTGGVNVAVVADLPVRRRRRSPRVPVSVPVSVPKAAGSAAAL
jgi:DNA-binding CsgD family transcriptional regulator